MGLKRVQNAAKIEERRAVKATGEDPAALFSAAEIDKIQNIQDMKAYLKRLTKVQAAASEAAGGKGRV